MVIKYRTRNYKQILIVNYALKNYSTEDRWVPLTIEIKSKDLQNLIDALKFNEFKKI